MEDKTLKSTTKKNSKPEERSTKYKQSQSKFADSKSKITSTRAPDRDELNALTVSDNIPRGTDGADIFQQCSAASNVPDNCLVYNEIQGTCARSGSTQKRDHSNTRSRSRSRSRLSRLFNRKRRSKSDTDLNNSPNNEDMMKFEKAKDVNRKQFREDETFKTANTSRENMNVSSPQHLLDSRNRPRDRLRHMKFRDAAQEKVLRRAKSSQHSPLRHDVAVLMNDSVSTSVVKFPSSPTLADTIITSTTNSSLPLANSRTPELPQWKCNQPSQPENPTFPKRLSYPEYSHIPGEEACVSCADSGNDAVSGVDQFGEDRLYLHQSVRKSQVDVHKSREDEHKARLDINKSDDVIHKYNQDIRNADKYLHKPGHDAQKSLNSTNEGSGNQNVQQTDPTGNYKDSDGSSEIFGDAINEDEDTRTLVDVNTSSQEINLNDTLPFSHNRSTKFVFQESANDTQVEPRESLSKSCQLRQHVPTSNPLRRRYIYSSDSGVTSSDTSPSASIIYSDTKQNTLEKRSLQHECSTLEDSSSPSGDGTVVVSSALIKAPGLPINDTHLEVDTVTSLNKPALTTLDDNTGESSHSITSSFRSSDQGYTDLARDDDTSVLKPHEALASAGSVNRKTRRRTMSSDILNKLSDNSHKERDKEQSHEFRPEASDTECLNFVSREEENILRSHPEPENFPDREIMLPESQCTLSSVKRSNSDVDRCFKSPRRLYGEAHIRNQQPYLNKRMQRGLVATFPLLTNIGFGRRKSDPDHVSMTSTSTVTNQEEMADLNKIMPGVLVAPGRGILQETDTSPTASTSAQLPSVQAIMEKPAAEIPTIAESVLHVVMKDISESPVSHQYCVAKTVSSATMSALSTFHEDSVTGTHVFNQPCNKIDDVSTFSHPRLLNSNEDLITKTNTTFFTDKSDQQQNTDSKMPTDVPLITGLDVPGLCKHPYSSEHSSVHNLHKQFQINVGEKSLNDSRKVKNTKACKMSPKKKGVKKEENKKQHSEYSSKLGEKDNPEGITHTSRPVDHKAPLGGDHLLRIMVDRECQTSAWLINTLLRKKTSKLKKQSLSFSKKKMKHRRESSASDTLIPIHHEKQKAAIQASSLSDIHKVNVCATETDLASELEKTQFLSSRTNRNSWGKGMSLKDIRMQLEDVGVGSEPSLSAASTKRGQDRRCKNSEDLPKSKSLSLAAAIRLRTRLAKIKKKKQSEQPSCVAVDDHRTERDVRRNELVTVQNEFNSSKLEANKETVVDDEDILDAEFPLNYTKQQVMFEHLSVGESVQFEEPPFNVTSSTFGRMHQRRQSSFHKRKTVCVQYCKKFIAFLFSHIGLCSLVVAYTIMGGFIFQALENDAEYAVRTTIRDQREKVVGRLVSLAVLFEPSERGLENLTAHVNETVLDYQGFIYAATKDKGWDGIDGPDEEGLWTFASSLLYAITVTTTIGYGHVSPKTPEGRIVTIGYAVVGIPLTLLCLTNIGDVMATGFRLLYGKVCCGICCRVFKSRQRKIQSDVENGLGGSEAASEEDIDDASKDVVHVPTSLCLLLIAGYIFAGAMLFSLWESWDVLTGSYFCFITLSTIGFGDIVPGMDSKAWAAEEKLILCALYLLLGLSLIAMCFNLVQEDVKAKCRWLGMKLGIVEKPHEIIL